MRQKLKKSSFLLLALIFLAPSIVKLGHHHKEFYCNAKSEKHFHIYHEKCEICQFDLSLFKTENSHQTSKIEIPNDNYSNKYCSVFTFNYSQFSFLLRAPPQFS